MILRKHYSAKKDGIYYTLTIKDSKTNQYATNFVTDKFGKAMEDSLDAFGEDFKFYDCVEQDKLHYQNINNQPIKAEQTSYPNPNELKDTGLPF